MPCVSQVSYMCCIMLSFHQTNVQNNVGEQHAKLSKKVMDSLEVISYPHSAKKAELQVFNAPGNHRIHLLSVSKLIIALDQTYESGVVCKLERFSKRVCQVVADFLHMEKGIHPWGNGSCVAKNATQPRLLLLVCQVNFL
ncbi:hypothetical protein CRENBAI_002824 [Crenichthys baileyi]|uniref:Uncharacterized protein n=1 Tax=Crenichthys baileyi TaxID=28760 RepID=A0AAV9RNM2_9TELE